MRKFYFTLIYLLLVFQNIISPQNRRLDSLKISLSKSTTTDDSVQALCQLAWNTGNLNPGLTYKYGMEALGKKQRIRDQQRISEIYDAAALGYLEKGNTEKAKELYQLSLDIGYRYNFPVRIAWGNYNLGEFALNEMRIEDVHRHAKKARDAFRYLNDQTGLILSDWLFLRTDKNNINPYIDTTINDYRSAESISTDPDILLDQYLNLVFLYGRKENRSMSMHYALKALNIAEANKNQKGLLKAYYSIANYLRDYQHNYDVALLYYKKILAMQESSKREQGITEVMSDIGIVYKLMGNYKLALDYFNRSLQIGERIKHRHSIARAYQYIGEIAKEEKRYSEALDYYSKCYATGCDVCPKIAFHKVLVQIGNVYLATKDYANALKFFNKSLSLADSSNAPSEIAESYSSLGDLYENTNQYEKALGFYHTALNVAGKANSFILRKEISFKLSSIYEHLNNYEKAYEYLIASNNLADSLDKLNHADDVSRLETKFEFQNLKLQKEIADKEIGRQTQLKYYFIVSFILALCLGFVLYIGFRRKKQDNIILAEQKKQLEKMSQKIHEADQKRLSFFTNISHELRTPLTLILGPIEKLLKEYGGNKTDTHLLQIARRNTLHLHNLINQLLDIRKLDTGNVKLKVKPGDISAYCRSIFSTFTHLADENGIKFNFSSDCEKIIALFDPDIIEKTLNNLLSNAFKYTPSQGEINLSLSYHATTSNCPQIKIIVRDNGKGIPDDQVQYVFDRYYQVENTNTGFNTGTGIGLAYTKELIGLHKGTIDVQSKSGSGSVFTIILPVEKTGYSEDEMLKPDAVENEEDKNDIRQKYLEEIIKEESRVDNADVNSGVPVGNIELKVMLLVEDNGDLREFIKSIFCDEYKIFEAPDGLQGLALANELIPDIIISDIMMPLMDGLQLTDKLKSDIHTNHIPVLILTAKTGIENEIEGLRTGADDYLTKPFNEEILKIRVNRLIESKKNLREYFVKEFLLNPKEVKLNSAEDEFLKKAVKIVENNISNPDLDVELLMNELSVSRMQLHRKLKAVTNLSANVFIRNIKLKRAAQLLLLKRYNVTEVLYESGFNSPSYFTSCFKEMYGCLPKEYAAKSQNFIELPD